jgi:hypothetical protein|tara:strand:+ start:863 stop:1018 length:156 start_codon:yes stop_codon:yes gene_type:complete
MYALSLTLSPILKSQKLKGTCKAHPSPILFKIQRIREQDPQIIKAFGEMGP